MAAYWRVRLKNQDGEFARDAWERNEIGIWYGAWSAEDFRNAAARGRTSQEVADILNNLPAQQNLVESAAWDRPIQATNIDTVRRFFDKISEGDWVVVYLGAERAIALAQMHGVVYSDVTIH